MTRSTLSTLSIALLLSVSIANAQSYVPLPNTDIPGLDIPSPGNPIQVSLATTTGAEAVSLCQQNCDHNLRCMAFTWVRSSGKCFLKASSLLFDEERLRSLTSPNNDTVSGIKNFTRSSSCWARHIFNLKFCRVVFAGTSGGPNTTSLTTFVCPPGSRSAIINNGAVPGQFDRFCVVRLATDPGNLPNCTDAFGGESHEADVLGNSVNQACLDAD